MTRLRTADANMASRHRFVPAMPWVVGFMAIVAAVSWSDSVNGQFHSENVCADPYCDGAAGSRPFCGVQCPPGCGREGKWSDWRPIPWEVFAHGEYVGPHRSAHVAHYRLRVNDVVEFVYRLTREQSSRAYELNVGDEIRMELLTEEEFDRELVVQPDGTISVPMLGQVPAAKRTVQELQTQLEEQYKKYYYKIPSVTITPLRVNAKLEDLRATVDSRMGAGGQSRSTRVTEEGTVQLVAIGSVPAQGLTLDELKREVDARYAAVVEGIEVTPILQQRAPRLVYVVGEVNTPGRFEMQAPTTAMQAVALAGGWRNGANLRQVVVFRRDENWQLMATRLDLRGSLLGKRPCPADEIWLRDSDVVLIPKTPVRRANDLIESVFTEGIYRVAPFMANGFTSVGELR